MCGDHPGLEGRTDDSTLAKFKAIHSSFRERFKDALWMGSPWGQFARTPTVSIEHRSSEVISDTRRPGILKMKLFLGDVRNLPSEDMANVMFNVTSRMYSKPECMNLHPPVHTLVTRSMH
jgi:hypothetical protein